MSERQVLLRTLARVPIRQRAIGASRGVRSAVCAIACSLCFGAAACSGDADRDSSGTSTAATTTRSTVAAAEYARRADAVCRREIARVLAARTQPRLKRIQATSASDEQKLRRAAPILAQQLELISDFRRELEALRPPGRPSGGRSPNSREGSIRRDRARAGNRRGKSRRRCCIRRGHAALCRLFDPIGLDRAGLEAEFRDLRRRSVVREPGAWALALWRGAATGRLRCRRPRTTCSRRR